MTNYCTTGDHYFRTVTGPCDCGQRHGAVLVSQERFAELEAIERAALAQPPAPEDVLRREYLMSLDELVTWCHREHVAIERGEDPGNRTGLANAIRHAQAVALRLSNEIRAR